MLNKTNTPKNVRCYDNGGETIDRYTVVYMDQPEQRGMFAAVGMNSEPFHPQGFGQHCTAMPGKHLGKRIPFKALPADCQKLVLQDLKPFPLHIAASPIGSGQHDKSSV